MTMLFIIFPEILKGFRRYYKIISPKPEIFESIYNKELLIKLCQSINVPVPLSWFPENPEDVRISELKFPLLLKGKNGLTFYKKTGKKAMLIIAPENLEKILDSVIRQSSVFRYFPSEFSAGRKEQSRLFHLFFN